MLITLLRESRLGSPVRIDGRTVLEDGAPVVWFTFPGEWHDVGRFHRADGTFTGIYANVIEPVRFLAADVWEITDLFLDLWHVPGRKPRLLDEDELQRAESAGWIDRRAGAAARAEADRLMRGIAAARWPPKVIGEWTLERAVAALRQQRDRLD